jgi:hypothetical protein
MGPFGTNPWVAAYVRRMQERQRPVPMSADDVRRQIDEAAAAAWDAWTPELSAADAFKARLRASLAAYYRRRVPG